jgi:hypothetical protein
VIFSRQLAHLVLAGRKTQTRRLVKDSDAGVCRYRPGHTYAVQSRRGGPSRGRIEILSAEEQLLGDITFEDARAEGFRSREEFFAHWAEERGRVQPGELDELDPAERAEVLKRIADEPVSVWKITFKPTEDVRFLHRDSSHGYTHNPHQAMAFGEEAGRVEPEPEPVDEETQHRITRAAHEKAADEQREAWLEQRERIAGSIDHLKKLGMGKSVVSELRVIERRLAAVDRKLAA